MKNIIPENDTKEHVLDVHCWCEPRIETEDAGGDVMTNGPLIIHFAADGRTDAKGLPGKGWFLHETLIDEDDNEGEEWKKEAAHE